MFCNNFQWYNFKRNRSYVPVSDIREPEPELHPWCSYLNFHYLPIGASQTPYSGSFVNNFIHSNIFLNPGQTLNWLILTDTVFFYFLTIRQNPKKEKPNGCIIWQNFQKSRPFYPFTQSEIAILTMQMLRNTSKILTSALDMFFKHISDGCRLAVHWISYFLHEQKRWLGFWEIFGRIDRAQDNFYQSYV